MVCQSPTLAPGRSLERQLVPTVVHAAVVQRPAGRKQNYMGHSESSTSSNYKTRKECAYTSGKLLGVFNTGTCCLGLKALTYPLRSPCFTGSSFLKSAPGAHGVSAQFGDYTTTELESCWPRLARDSWTQRRFFVRLKLGIVIDLEQRPLSLSD